MVTLSDTAEEIAYVLADVDEAVSHQYLIENTSVDSVKESKQALNELLQIGALTTTPGFKYRLAHNSTAEEFKD